MALTSASERHAFGKNNTSPQIAMEGGATSVMVKDSYNRQAAGTFISTTRDMDKSILTSIVLKPHIIMMNIKSTGMLVPSHLLAMSFPVFENQDILVDCVAVSEGKISMIIVPSELSSRELVQLELDIVVEQLKKFAVVDQLEDNSVIFLVGNSEVSPLILEKAFSILRSIDVKFEMITQVSSEEMAEPNTSVVGCRAFPGNDLVIPAGSDNLVTDGYGFADSVLGVNDYLGFDGLDDTLGLCDLDRFCIPEVEAEEEHGPAEAVVSGDALELEGMECSPQETTDMLRMNFVSAMQELSLEFIPEERNCLLTLNRLLHD